ncbi:hypothetical protein M1116_03645 [Patescibacteria group bacterium]|nr:hypothetical protein [Patescibacteria group bacterium]
MYDYRVEATATVVGDPGTTGVYIKLDVISQQGSKRSYAEGVELLAEANELYEPCTTRSYVEFYYVGVFFDEHTTKEVTNRDEYEVEVPEGVYAFRFFDVKSLEVVGIRLKSDRLNVSPMFYYGGRVMNAEEVKKLEKEPETVLRNMKVNGWDKVIRCRMGNFKPFLPGDILLKTK